MSIARTFGTRVAERRIPGPWAMNVARMFTLCGMSTMVGW
jgi:hypothetical protein